MPNDLDPTTNPDAQEALSRAHGHGAVLVLPLRSGRFAIIDRSNYQLAAILDTAPTGAELLDFSKAQTQKMGLMRMLTSEARFYGEPTDREWKTDALRAKKTEMHRSTNRIVQPKAGTAFDLGDL